MKGQTTMRLWGLSVLVMLLAASQVTHAVYNAATPVAKALPDAEGRVSVTYEFTGPSETPRRISRFVDSETDVELRRWVQGMVAALNQRKSASDAIALGQPVDMTPIVPTAREAARAAWLADYRLLLRLRSAGSFPAGALTTDIAALAAKVSDVYEKLNATDRAFYLAGL
jgi:hypothetical protein